MSCRQETTTKRPDASSPAGGVDAALATDSRPGGGSADAVAGGGAPDQGGGGEGGGEAAGGTQGDGPIVYIGSASEIRVYQIDTRTGSLASRGAVTGATAGASYAAVNASRGIFYAGHRLAAAGPDAGGGSAGMDAAATPSRPAALTAYTMDAISGALTKLGSTLTLPFEAGPTHVGLSADGKTLFVALFGPGAVASVSVGADGAPAVVVDNKTTAGGRRLTEAHQAYIEGSSLLVPCRSANLVAQFGVDSDGKLTELSPAFLAFGSPPVDGGMMAGPDGGSGDGGMPGPSGPGPRHLVVNRAKTFAYLVNELDGTVAVHAYQMGKIGAQVQVMGAVPSDAPARETASAHPVLHPKDDTLLYVSNRSNPSVDVFKIDPATGRLGRLQHETGGGMVKLPRDFEIDPDGKFLVIANERPQPDNLANVFAIEADGRLTLKSSIATQANAQYVYVGAARR